MVSMLYALILSAFVVCSASQGQGWSWQLSTTPSRGSTFFPVMASSAQHRLTLNRPGIHGGSQT